ncbi:MAG: L-threonylcarbamoyladenylate synthase, partial [Alkalispirochaeta sp.]
MKTESYTSRSKPDSGRRLDEAQHGDPSSRRSASRSSDASPPPAAPSPETSLLRRTQLLGPEDTAVAGELLRGGELVVIPTETVYGLAADATNSEAVQAIFAAKGRPQDNPLIVHLSSVSDALQLIPDDLEAARRALASFAPGPLTVVVPSPTGIASVVRGGLDTVALRVPAHPGASAIIAAAGVPVAAPSANRSGRPSPTTFAMARWEMEGRVGGIVEGGDTDIGIESTVVDGTDPHSLRILRPGSISAEELREAIRVPIYTGGSAGDGEQRSPGTRYRHYQPTVPVEAFESGTWDVVCRTILSDETEAIRVVLTATSELPRAAHGKLDVVIMTSTAEYARRLYREFRRAEE